MNADTQKRIFEPFYTTARSAGKSGLGLQIVANIVTIQLHGKIECASVLGQGTRFEIEFPAS